MVERDEGNSCKPDGGIFKTVRIVLKNDCIYGGYYRTSTGGRKASLLIIFSSILYVMKREHVRVGNWRIDTDIWR